MHIKKYTLDNGMKVAICSAPQFQTVGITVGVKYGSVDEKPAINGAAHYLEHMLFKGTKKRTWQEIHDEARNLGMNQNAFTNKETTAYFLGAYKGYFSRAADLLSDMIKNSTFPEKEFELERGPILNENLIRSDTPMYFFYDFMPKALYAKHAAKMPVAGDEDAIKRTTRQDILKVYDKYYNPRNMIVSVYGGVSQKNALDTIKKNFGEMDKEYAAPARQTAKEKQEKKEIVINKRGIRQTRIGIGFKTKSFADSGIREYLAVSVMTETVRRRMFDEVRDKRGLSYDPNAFYMSYNTFGFISSVAGVEPKNLDKAKAVMLDVFEGMQNGEIDRKELENRKRGLSIKYMVGREDTLDMSLEMADSYLTYGDTTLPERLPNLIKTVTLDEIRKYSEMYIDVDRYGMVTLKPER